MIKLATNDTWYMTPKIVAIAKGATAPINSKSEIKMLHTPTNKLARASEEQIPNQSCFPISFLYFLRLGINFFRTLCGRDLLNLKMPILIFM